MSKRIPLEGKTIGEWNILSYAGNKKKKSYYLCRCSCGKEYLVRADKLRSGKTSKCKNCQEKFKKNK